ncbi:NB-ARC domains-containing protein [Tanacetum coccineum]|uniref:NB-ARC domains-containing protein n=1 Tax=Tanacetum coccineum TaxID=301880 RepID=A0ABQ5ESV3_9ASTR
MATTSIPHRWKYDVFVSFRGEDIRKTFMDHLFNDFKQKGIHAFSDDRELPKGEEISPHLYKAIEESRFLIVIFSKNYASSTWCLRELVKILECKQIENPKHEVRIIFYDAKPDVVRKQKRSYAEAFIDHEVSNKTEVDKWREALSMAANLSGWDLQDMTNGFESKFINNISSDIFKMLHDGPLHVGENLVGVDILLDRLNLSRFVGGPNKKIQRYQLLLKELWKKRKGWLGKPESCCLDDVDDHKQLDSLAGSASWFCPGSLIIFTGKDKQLLRSHGVDEIHDMKFLDEHQSLQLFAMAREIVSEESSMPGNRSRLWVNPSEIYNILSEMNATQAVEIIDLLQTKSSQKFDIDGKQFAANEKLRILKLSITMLWNFSEVHYEKLPLFVSSLINLESLSFGGQGRIQPIMVGLSITAPFGLLSKQHRPPRSLSLAGLHMLKELNFSYCNLEQVPESIGGLNLSGNNFSSLPGSLSQLSHLRGLFVDGCKKLEVLPKLPPKMWDIYASDCTSLREVSVSSKGSLFNVFRNCPKLFKNVTIDSEGCIHQLSAFLGYVGLQTNRCEFFSQDSGYPVFDILYHGNSMPEWFTNRSRENHVKVELPSDWCYDKNFRGFGTCVVFKCKKHFSTFKEGYSVYNFDGTSIEENCFPLASKEFLKKEVIGIQDSYMIWLHYTRSTWEWKEAKNFVTFSFFEKNNNEDVEVKEFGVRIICDEDIQQETDVSMLQVLPIPTQHGGVLRLDRAFWSW